MKIKTFWKSLDLRKNKILNARVNTPVDVDEIAPKGYVDDSTKYDTEKAEQFTGGSPKFPWMNFSLHGKTFKELFDNLFFPVVLPTYQEVFFEKVVVTALGEYGNNLFQGRITNFNIDYVINRGDRQSTQIPKIRVTTKTPVTVTEYNGSSSGNTGNFNFSFNLQNIDKIELVKQFDAVSVVKNDNYGNPYIPVVFTQPYEAVYDVFSNLKNNYVIHNPIMYRKLVPNENESDITNSIIDGSAMSSPMQATIATFTKDRKFFSTADVNNNFMFAFPESLLVNYNLNVKISEGVPNLFLPPSNFDLTFDVPKRIDKKTLSYFGESIVYVFYVIDFGYHETIKEINLSVNKYKQS